MNNLDNIDFSKIKFVLMDMDGVLTDGTVLYSSDGEEIIKVFSVYDGYGIERGHRHGLKFAIISGRSAKANEHRARKLKIDILYQDCGDKVAAYNEIMKKFGLERDNFCYIGDEIFDLPLLNEVMFSCAPANAVDEVKEAVDYVAIKEGGKGAVREIIDLILRKRNLI
ncbi:MAG: 3-deoxy-D-manno-octulosonate 8-phosphate phosphatase [Ignavibacteriae bacterium]|nr:MAG: 3-deoxy-D-manno-octulosonate 8-phosphate phosphatase [Ignavibacteriota bacterium]